MNTIKDDTVYSILETIADTSSRNEKEAILKAFSGHKTLKECIRLAYDPFVLFYVKKPISYVPQHDSYTSLDNALKELVETISSRKKTGNEAIVFLKNLLESLNQKDADVLTRVIAKDLRCGFTEGTANKIWKGLVPTYPCMLCEQMDEKLIAKMPFPAIFQMKMDGMRFNAIVKNDTVEFRSRNGQPLELHGILDQVFIRMADGMDIVFDGELLILDKDGGVPIPRHISNGLIRKAAKGGGDNIANLAASLWDVIAYRLFNGGYDATPYEQRFESLKQRVASIKTNRISLVESNIVKNLLEAQLLFKDYLNAGYEGGILKNMKGPWEDKRSRNQLKFKAELECDLKCVSFEEGTGKYKGMIGALICESFDGIIKVNVGSGFTDEQRQEKPPIGKIIAVKYNARIKDSLFLPVFIEIRDDKNEADPSSRIK